MRYILQITLGFTTHADFTAGRLFFSLGEKSYCFKEKKRREKMKFYTKIDWWVHIVLLIFIYQAIKMLYLAFTQSSILTISFCLIFIVFLAFVAFPIYFGTYYKLEDTCLYIHCGFIFRFRIPYQDILRIAPIKGLLPGYGLSSRRLGVFFRAQRGGLLIVSPKERERFLKEMNKKNPFIDTNTGISEEPMQVTRPSV